VADGHRDARGLAGAWVHHQCHGQAAPAADLATWIERYWTVEWAYAVPYRQVVVPYPQVHVTVRPGRAPVVSGVASRATVRELAGSDRIVGAAFRPGTFRALLDGPVSGLTDRQVDAADVPGLAGRPGAPVDVAALETWLRALLPAGGPARDGAEAGEVVALAAADRALTRVDQLATAAGTGVRRLQRLFAEHVGVGPKWVLRRYRLCEVTERIATGERIDWAGLAADLGYADQAHLVRDFAALFGEPPTRWASRY